MIIRQNFLITLAFFMALLSFAQSLSADQSKLLKKAEFDSVMPVYSRIDWRDPLNFDYANLGNDQFLLDTKQGLMLWNVPDNTFSKPDFTPETSKNRWTPPDIDHSWMAWVRLGRSAGDTLVSLSSDAQNTLLLWWDGKKRRFAAALNMEGQTGPKLLSLGADYVLVCSQNRDSKVLRLGQIEGNVSLTWEGEDNPEALAALRATGVVGSVHGFKTLTAEDLERPVYFDTSHCGWEIKNPPEHIKPFLDKKTRKSVPGIKPYFLADGRILLSEVEYFDGQYWRNMNPPLLWQDKTRNWLALEHTAGDGGRINNSGQGEPVTSYAFQSVIVEFFDSKTLHWVRSQQRLPESYNVHIEPLRDGRAVVFLDGNRVGLIAPAQKNMPHGKLASRRNRYDGELKLNDRKLMLIGDGDPHDPSARVEVIDVAKRQAKPVASLPNPLFSPYALVLKDKRILVFGGLPAGCGQSFYLSSSSPCRYQTAQSSFLYFPDKDHWQALPDLKIPVTTGYSWQTGNSYLSTQWPRNDVLIRQNGDVVWIEGGQRFNSTDEKLPQISLLKSWHPKDQSIATVSSLRKARSQSSLIELADGRLAVIGGHTQIGQAVTSNYNPYSPRETEFNGTFVPARSTDWLDETNKKKPVWKAGPKAFYGGGRALKLANGRIFKFSLTASFGSEGYRAEIADATFTHWERLPPFPVDGTPVRNISVAGNRVIILTDANKTVAWDDQQQTWHVWDNWPVGVGNKNNPPISITGFGEDKKVLVRYHSSFDVVNLP